MTIYSHALVCLLAWIHPNPSNVARLKELAAIAVEIARTDATETEAEELVAICIHESGCRTRAKGRDGSVGAWQIHPPAKAYDAAEALARVRWSVDTCGDLSLYAGCGRCGTCPAIVESLVNPTLPRR